MIFFYGSSCSDTRNVGRLFLFPSLLFAVLMKHKDVPHTPSKARQELVKEQQPHAVSQVPSGMKKATPE